MKGIDKALIPFKQVMADEGDFMLNKAFKFSERENADNILKSFGTTLSLHGNTILKLEKSKMVPTIVISITDVKNKLK